MANPKAKWTILTYIAAHNDLNDYGLRSWQQISKVGSTRQVVQGVLFDGQRGASRYVFGDPGRQLLKDDFANFDSGDPARLVETAAWLFRQYPAENYGLVLWSHGTGWQPQEIQRVAQQARGDDNVMAREAEQRSTASPAPALFRTSLARMLSEESPADRAILFDDGSQHSLDTLELQKAVDAICEVAGSPLTLLGMDACLMASIETAYQVRKAARYYVASEELVPAESWPYETIYGALKANPDLSGRDLARLITQNYLAYYQQKIPPFSAGDVTKIALDLSQIDALTRALAATSKMMAAEMNAIAPALWNAQVACRDRERHNRRQTKFDLHLWDIYSLISELAGQASGDALQHACETVTNLFKPGGAVLDQVHLGSWFDGTGGLSIYLPVPIEVPRVTLFYPDLQFARDTGWDGLLASYYQAARRRAR